MVTNQSWIMVTKYFLEECMDLTKAQTGEEYIIKEIVTDDEELNAFLFSSFVYYTQFKTKEKKNLRG